MSNTVVWLDWNQARVFEISEEKMERRNLQRQNGRSWVDDVCEVIATAKRILILGPDSAKFELQSLLQSRFPEAAKRIVGCESVEFPNDAQIASRARQLFLSVR